MGILRDRVATRDQRAALAEMETAFGLRFTREAAQAAYYDSFDEALLEGGRPARPALSAQKRGIERMATAYRKAHFSAYGVEPDETWMSGLDQVIDMINPDEVQHTTSVRWKEEHMCEIPLALRYDLKQGASKMDVGGNTLRLLKKLVSWRVHGLE